MWNKPKKSKQMIAHAVADEVAEKVFDDAFREELRNRGRLHFEKIINENAMFLQHDLRLTTAQLNDYLKEQVTKKLKQEFARYEESIGDAKELAVDALTKTQQAIEQQRKAMSEQLSRELSEEKQRLINHFRENMAEIINHYVMASIGDQIDLNDQLGFIIDGLERNKEAIIKDINEGA